MGYYSIKDNTNLAYSLEEIWIITKSVITRCTKSFNELADIFEKIRDMEPCAIKLALTFRTAKSQFEAACILLTKDKNMISFIA